MPQFTEAIEILKNGQVTIKLNGEVGDILLGDSGTNGDVQLKDDQGRLVIHLAARDGIVRIGGGGTLGSPGPSGDIHVRDSAGQDTVHIDGNSGDILLGGSGVNGDVQLKDDQGKLVIHLAARDGIVRVGGGSTLGSPGPSGDIHVRDSAGQDTVHIDGNSGDILLGGSGVNGDVQLKDDQGRLVVHLAARDGIVKVGGGSTLGQPGPSGDIHVRNSAGNNTVRIDGEAGDIILQNADCAEDFDVAEDQEVEPGTVLVLDDEGRLTVSNQAYDRRVAGVVSGAGDYTPGMVLDRQPGMTNRLPIALVGKVFCKVDASYGAIQVGDLLTTSRTTGHAMRAADALAASGARIGKALRPLAGGSGLIPILVALQ